MFLDFSVQWRFKYYYTDYECNICGIKNSDTKHNAFGNLVKIKAPPSTLALNIPLEVWRGLKWLHIQIETHAGNILLFQFGPPPVQRDMSGLQHNMIQRLSSTEQLLSLAGGNPLIRRRTEASRCIRAASPQTHSKQNIERCSQRENGTQRVS